MNVNHALDCDAPKSARQRGGIGFSHPEAAKGRKMSAKDNAIRLVVKNESYYSRLDEDSFYAWLDKIACVEKYHGQGRELYIDVDRLRVDDSSLRELLAVFERYKIDMRQLAIFKHKNNENWFCDPQKYWFEKVFGSDAQKPK